MVSTNGSCLVAAAVVVECFALSPTEPEADEALPAIVAAHYSGGIADYYFVEPEENYSSDWVQKVRTREYLSDWWPMRMRLRLLLRHVMIERHLLE